MTRYAITHINRDGFRQISYANQGRHHFDDTAKAFERLDALNENNSIDTLKQVFGEQSIGTFAVSPIDCYDHGDAKGIYPKCVIER